MAWTDLLQKKVGEAKFALNLVGNKGKRNGRYERHDNHGYKVRADCELGIGGMKALKAKLADTWKAKDYYKAGPAGYMILLWHGLVLNHCLTGMKRASGEGSVELYT